LLVTRGYLFASTGTAISLNVGGTHFDNVYGDLFRERTSWLKSDGGFLVLDANGDGKLAVVDAVSASLQVWQGKGRSGVTQNGELKTLDQLGITELSLAHNPLSATPDRRREAMVCNDNSAWCGEDPV